MSTQELHDSLLTRARHGTDDDWDVIDSVLTVEKNPELLGPTYVHRAVYDLLADPSDNVRDFGMTILDRSPEPLDEAMTGIVRDSTARDASMVVRMRGAIALYKRGSNDEFVRTLWSKACEDEGALGKDAKAVRRSA